MIKIEELLQLPLVEAVAALNREWLPKEQLEIVRKHKYACSLRFKTVKQELTGLTADSLADPAVPVVQQLETYYKSFWAARFEELYKDVQAVVKPLTKEQLKTGDAEKLWSTYYQSKQLDLSGRIKRLLEENVSKGFYDSLDQDSRVWLCAAWLALANARLHDKPYKPQPAFGNEPHLRVTLQFEEFLEKRGVKCRLLAKPNTTSLKKSPATPISRKPSTLTSK